MEENTVYLAKFETTTQISPDDYRVTWKEKLFNENTTLKDITDWYSKLSPGPTQVILTELEFPPKTTNKE